ncbi:uncharacterized protein DUF4476 [Pontibacter ummariensis]|uniref:DUF4476 domain-containing protein n=1 Tax=Pontibacter ummariensis TaxID=1610492 RepID=A0A239GSJ9_9BACT|nr:DUF4476 domain-containing protein [Pontibacter ummariensis]PRY11040.1 uncharacterized protein DUF4476 [Pontibacter ummariensis]SNS72189.1 protein of unknown function [Pontibacter ummariensis]
MKKLLLPLLLVLLVVPAFAQAAVLTFTAERGEVFQIQLDDRTVNPIASNFVRIASVRPGGHYVEVKVRTRHGIYRMGQKIVVPEGVEASYLVRTAGRSGKAYLRLIKQVPLAPPVVASPLPRYPDRYEDHQEPYRQPVRPRYDNDYSNNCSKLMTEQELDRLVQTMGSRDFESTKLSIARDAVRHGSILADDLKRILQQFEYESTQIEFAKYAYDYLCDREHFYYIYDLFQFDSSVRELEEYTDRRR